MLILVTGLTGAGKSTYCHEYIEKKAAKTFSIDQWMKSLYWQYMPAMPDMQWFVENQKWYSDRIARCEELIKKEVSQLARLDFDILLDLGFTNQSHRKSYLELGRSLGLVVEIHHLAVDKNERWSRVEKRNKGFSETYTMMVSKEMFDYIEEVFEDFDEDELKVIKRITK